MKLLILTGKKIKQEVEQGNIIIDKFNYENVTTNSYDLTLDNSLIRYTTKEIDPKKQSTYEIFRIPNTGYLLDRQTFHLGSSIEVIGSTKYVPIIHAKSGIARLGLFVHVTADLIDIGSIGNITFQLYSTMPVLIYPNMKIAQVTFWNVDGEVTLYNGKYQGSKGPQVSKTYKDYN